MTMSSDAISARAVIRLRDGVMESTDDHLAVEEPLEIRVNGEPFTVTMRTPGDDFALARGLLLTEGLISGNADIAQIRHCDVGDSEIDNVVTVRLHAPPESNRQWQRTLMAGSSCGLCGKATLEAVTTRTSRLPDSSPFLAETILGFPEEMRRRQPLFGLTGGLHAVAILDGSGRCLAAAEDIGRHNATDKAIGHGVEEGWLPWRGNGQPLALLVSGRASFEITQKALMAGIPVVCAVSAASSLAVQLATSRNQTLIGFLRGQAMTIYAGAERVLPAGG